MQQIINYFSEVKVELTKVVWPKREEVIRLTMVVIFISLIVALYVGGIDFGFTKLLESILTR